MPPSPDLPSIGTRVHCRASLFSSSLRGGVVALLCALTLCAPGSAAGADGTRRHYDLPAGDASATLQLFVEQADAQVVYLVDRVRGVQTNAVRGEFAARAALEQMLDGTPLYVVQDDESRALVIHRRTTAQPGSAVANPPPVAVNNADAADASGASASDPVLVLPAFTVSSQTDVSYVGRQALSTTRTGVELLDLGQSVKVLNRAFIDDLSPGLLVDTLKYVGGGQAGNINFADDRFTLRGFNSPADIGDFVDGFRAKIDSNTDLAIVDRLEIIKGPSAIFVANGPVGGVINKVTKSPVSFPLRTLKVQAGLFDSNRVELDLGGPLTGDKRWLYRTVVAGQYSGGWYDHTYNHRFVFAPSVRYVFDEYSQLTLKYFYFNFRFASYNGLPWDERTGRIIDIDRKSTFSEDDPLNWRKDIVHRGLVEYTTRFNEHLAMRLAAFHGWNNAARVESVNGISLPPTYVNGTPLARSTTSQDRIHLRTHVQGDLVATFNTGAAAHRLLVGGEWSDAPDTVASFGGTSSAIDPFNLQFPGTVSVPATPVSHLRTNNRQEKIFALETVHLFDEKLILSVGGSHVRARTSSVNRLNGQRTAPLTLTENLLQYGAVFKVAPKVSLFYGYNENFAPNFLNGQVLPSQIGQQHEVGIKAELAEGRLALNLAWFDIKQENVPVLSFPQTTPPSFVLVPGQSSRGVDADISWQVTDNIDVIGTFAILDARARSQANSAAPVIINPVNNVAEQTYGLWTRYRFASESLQGLAVGVGVSHLAKRAVTNNSNAILYGFIPGFTLADLVVTYDRGPVRYALNVDNLFDTEYEAAVRNQSIVVPGMGRNVKVTVAWKF